MSYLLVSNQKEKIEQLVAKRKSLQEERNSLYANYINLDKQNNSLSTELTNIDIELSDSKYKPTIISQIYSQKSSILSILKLSSDIQKNKNYKSILNELEKKHNIMILNTEKFKLLTHLGQCYEGIEKMLSINDSTLLEIDNQINNVINKENTQKITSINKNEENGKGIIITVIFKDEITNYEYEKNKISLSSDLKKTSMSVIEEDVLYEIKRKHTVLDILKKSCDFFNVDVDKYILINQSFLLYPFDLVIYDVLLKENCERGYTKPHCHYFQLSSLITEEMRFILTKKSNYKQFILTSIDKFLFAFDTPITREIEEIYNEYKKKTVLFQNDKKEEDIEKLISIYKMLFDITKVKIRIQTRTNRPQSILTTNSFNGFGIEMTTLKTIRNNLTSKQNAIVDQYQNFIDSFGMEYDTFFSYILEIYSTKDEIEDFKQFSEDAEDIRKEEDSSDNKSKADFDNDSNSYLSKAKQIEDIKKVARYIITYRNNNMIPKNYLKRIFKSTQKDIEIKCYKEYIQKQKEQIIKNQNPQKKMTFNLTSDKVISSSNKKNSREFNLLKLKELKEFSVPIWLVLIELIGIIFAFLFPYLMSNKISMKEKSYFNLLVTNKLNANDNCILKWKKSVKSYNDVNKWLDGCLLPLLIEQIANDTNTEKVSLYKVEFQIKSMVLSTCERVDDFNINFYNNSKPECFNKETSSKYEILKEYGLESESNHYESSLSFFDEIFSYDRRLIDSTFIELTSTEQLTNFQNLISSSIESTSLDNPISDYEAKLYKIISQFYSNSNSSKLIDNSTMEIEIDLFYYLNDLSIGIMSSFNFNSNERGKNMIQTTNQVSIFEFNPNYYTIPSFIVFVYLCFIMIIKAKYKKQNSIGKIVSENLFLILYFICIIIEILYTCLNTLKGYVNYTSYTERISNSEVFDKSIVIYNTIQLLKSIQVLFLTYYSLYIIFDSPKIVSFAYFFKAIFIRTIILIVLFISALALLFNFILGQYYERYSNYLNSFLTLLSASFGYINIDSKNGFVNTNFINQKLQIIHSFIFAFEIFAKTFIGYLLLSYVLYYYKKYYDDYFTVKKEDNLK